MDFYFAYAKIEHDKSHGHIKTMNILSRKSKILLWAKNGFNIASMIFMFTILGTQFSTSNVFAASTPTLSAAISNTNVTINGNQVINSIDRTAEIPLRLTVNTNNRTGYTATVSSESNNTALINNSSAFLAKIDSITTPSPLINLPNNTWGYRLASIPNYSPIPALATPASFRQTTEATNGVSVTDLNIGMKLASNLENGSYTNRLVFSVVTNPIDRRAVLMNGPEISKIFRKKQAGGYNYRIYSVRRCSASDLHPNQPYTNIADPVESDYEVKLWSLLGNEIYCYNSEAPVIYANQNSSQMFSELSFAYDIDLSGINTSEVTNMSSMFKGASSLHSLDLSRFDTRKVRDMSEMFSRIIQANGGVSFALDLSSFNTQNVTDMSNMFSRTEYLTTLYLTNFDTRNVTRFDNMFHLGRNDGDSLTRIYVKNDFNLSSAPNLRLEVFNGRRLIKTSNGSRCYISTGEQLKCLRIDRPGAPGYFTQI